MSFPFLFPVFTETQEPTEKKRVPILFPVFTETQELTEKNRVPFLFPAFTETQETEREKESSLIFSSVFRYAILGLHPIHEKNNNPFLSVAAIPSKHPLSLRS